MKKVIYSQSFIEFLKNSECKIATILYRLHLKKYQSNIVTANEINYLTFRKDGTISYLPTGKELKYNDSNEWSKDGRQNGKPAKVIRKLFSDKIIHLFKDYDFECFTNAYKANFNDDGYNFELLKNTLIPSVYDMDRSIGEGSINNSCMNGDTEYLDIYKFCDSLQILILKDKDGLLCGRSLVWTVGEVTLMDRIYVSQDFMYDKFLCYAKENKFWTKQDYKSYDNKRNFLNCTGDIVERTFTVKTNTSFEQYPYIDTFQYGGDGWISNSDTGEYTYNNTGGARDGGDDEEDNHDDEIYIECGQSRYRGEWYHIDDCVCVGDDWYHEDDDNICLVNGTYYTTDDSDITEINGDYYLTDDCTYCERDSCSYKQDDCVYCEDDEEDVLRDEAVEIDDKWYHKESDLIFEHNGKYYLEDAGVEA